MILMLGTAAWRWEPPAFGWCRDREIRVSGVSRE
jgi:hypothetical protein